jgi:hypothetical protein
MKNVLVTVVLTSAIVAVCQQQPTQPTQPGQTVPRQSGQTQQASTSVQPKVIKDPAEYDAYMKAFNMQDPAQKAMAMEVFVKQYPQSVVLTDALEQAMDGYERANDQAQTPAERERFHAKVEETARQMLQIVPNHIRALALVVVLERAKDPAALGESCTDATRGLQQLTSWTKPEGVTDAEFNKLRAQMAGVFNRASGACALQKNDFAGARTFYQKVFDPKNLEDIYQLAVADLRMDPIDPNGFWYGAKALSLLANDTNKEKFSKFVHSKYQKYHGQTDDWDKFAGVVASQSSPPTDIAALIPPAPTACEVAVDVSKKNKPEKLSLRDRAFILSQADCSSANLEAAEKVWKSIQAMEKGGTAMLVIPVKVILATDNSVDVAIVDEDNPSPDKADVHVELKKPLLQLPAPGTMTKVTGFITKYTPKPFMFTMEKGELAGTGANTPKHAAPRPRAQKHMG